MLNKAPNMTRQHYEFIADHIAPKVEWPSHLHDIADTLAATNPRFDKQKFLVRATKAWENNNLQQEQIDDEIMY